MRTWLILVLAAAAAVAVYFFVLSPGPETPPAEIPDGVARPDAEPPGGDEAEMAVPAPDERPPLEQLPFAEPVNVLILAQTPHRLNIFLARQWDSHPQVRVVSWCATEAPADPERALPTPELLPNPLTRKPGFTTLSDEKIHVVVVDDLDPATLEDDLWIDVVKGVEEGRLGLLALPGLAHGGAMLDHPVLGPLLPPETVERIRGTPPKGTFTGLAPFEVSAAGTRHPATRLVAWPEWSERIWLATQKIPTPWGTPFCYPVDDVRRGSQVLVYARPARGTEWPAIIAGDPAKGRVLWLGMADLGSVQAYGRPDVVADWQTLARNWISWLATRT